MWKGLAGVYAKQRRYRWITGLAAPLGVLQSSRLPPWTLTPELPRTAPKTLHQLAKEKGFDAR